MNPFDWDLYWEEKGENKRMIKGAIKMAKRIGIFLKRNNITSVADFGCGSGRTLFILSKQYPSISFYGFDSVLSILKKSRQIASEMGLSNLRFNHDILPNIKSREKFDLIYCIATLHYIKDIRKAIINLYKRVNNGGFLIFNYPNKYSMFWYRKHIKPSDKEMRTRFSLLLAGHNLLTLNDVKKVTGIRPKNFWDAVKEKGQRANVCVFVHKP
jgi:trans-aconitate methyltransferase